MNSYVQVYSKCFTTFVWFTHSYGGRSVVSSKLEVRKYTFTPWCHTNCWSSNHTVLCHAPVSAMPMLRMVALCFCGKSSGAALKLNVPSSFFIILKMRMVSPFANQVINALQWKGQKRRGRDCYPTTLKMLWVHTSLVCALIVCNHFTYI